MLEVIQSVDSWKFITPIQSISNKDLHSPLRLDYAKATGSNRKNVPYNVAKRWRQDGNTLYFTFNDIEVYFKMPTDWRIEETHEDLFRVANYVMTSPWEEGVLDDWIPSRKPGRRPGLAFSGVLIPLLRCS